MSEEANIPRIELIPPHVRAFLQSGYEDFEGFWERAALDSTGELYWFRKWDKAFESDYPTFRWYVGGQTNVCYSAVDYNVLKDRGGKAAIVSEIAETGEVRVVTYAQLLHLVKQYAAALRGLGVNKGDRVVIYMPMGVEPVVAMLACARIGAIHVVVFAGFSYKAVADRIQLSGAEYVLTQDVNHRRGAVIELKKVIDDAIEEVPYGQVKKVVVLQKASDDHRPMQEGRDITWEDFLAMAEGQSGEVEIMESNEPLFLLPTSGTTAKPKVTVHVPGPDRERFETALRGMTPMKSSPKDVMLAGGDVGTGRLASPESIVAHAERQLSSGDLRGVRMLVTAADVIHNWWVPDFGMKKDAIPGYINELWFRADKVGTYRGQCAELCGRDHGFMPVVVRVVEQAEYDSWLASQKAARQAAAAPAAQTAAVTTPNAIGTTAVLVANAE